MTQRKLKITLHRSRAHRSQDHLRTLQALGLRKLGATVTRPDNPAVRGMLRKLAYILESREA